MPEDRLGEYIQEVSSARRRWEGKLQVFLGLEADYISGLMGPGDPEIQSLGLDYIIGSVHYVTPPQGEPFAVDGPAEEFEQDVREKFNGDGEAVMEAYWDAVENMIHAGGFDILGHADLIKKNNSGDRWFKLQGERYQERLTRTAMLAAESGVVVEVNTGGLARGRYPELYPSPAFLGFRKLPVTINADAHKAEQLGGYYDTAREALLAAGYTNALLFEGRRDGQPLWSEDPL
jgi:histidinol-phosphatase (PHP family)